MARFLPFTLLLLSLMAAAALARPTPVESRVIAFQFDRPREANGPSSSCTIQESRVAGAPEGVLQQERHQTSDKSIAGAEVMIGGLVTVIFATIFAYIRVTRKRSWETKV